MMEVLPIAAREAARIIQFVLRMFAHTWVLWVVSIPLAAVIKMSPIADRLKSVLSMKPVAAVVAATMFGAMSPLCSCSVVPVIFSLLSAGVPLAPVMSFWLASPSMDPEIFFMSVSTIGWPLAIARLLAATLMSLGGGLLTIVLEKRGFFSGGILRAPAAGSEKKRAAGAACGCSGSAPAAIADSRFVAMPGILSPLRAGLAARSSASSPMSSKLKRAYGMVQAAKRRDYRALAKHFGKELLSSLLFVGKFMAIAYVLEAAIKFYVPEAWIRAALGAQNAFAVPLAVLVGIPFYTTNAQALGMVGGLLGKGMSEGAALSFLIGGATTTLPAMTAVYGIAKPRVFAVYLGSAVVAAFAAGMIWSLF